MSAIPQSLAIPGSLDLTAYMDPVIYRGIDSPTPMAPIVAHVVVEEDHDDELQVTEHPVEYGAAVSDHAFKRPSEVRIRMGWTQSGFFQSTGYAQPVQDVRTVYEQLLALQSERRPFTVYTGKKVYNNMLVAGLKVHTDVAAEHALLCDVSLREVILVHTQTVAGNIPTDATQLGNPPSNQPTGDNGNQRPIPKSLTAQNVSDYGGNLQSALKPGVGQDVTTPGGGAFAPPDLGLVPPTITPPGQLPEVPSTGPLVRRRYDYRRNTPRPSTPTIWHNTRRRDIQFQALLERRDTVLGVRHRGRSR